MTDDTLASPGPTDSAPLQPAPDTVDTGATDQPGDQTTAETPEQTEDGPDKDRNKNAARSYQKRLDELTRLRRDAERDREYWREIALRSGQQQPTQPAQPAQPSLSPPQQKDFQTYEEYIDARADWKARTTIAAAQEAHKRQSYQLQQEAFQADLVSRRNQALETARTKYPDYHDVIDSSDAPITPAMDMAMVESGMAGDVAYFFGKNSQEAHRIAQLTTAAQMLEIGRIVAKLSAQPAPRTTNAPDPPRTLSGSSNGPSGAPKDLDAWMAWRNKQVRGS
jgi:hypothetical protein